MFKEIAIFSLGTVCGGVIAWQILKKEYAMESQEEIDAMTAYYKEKYGEGEKTKKEEPKKEDAPPKYDKVDDSLFEQVPVSVYKRYGNDEPKVDPAEMVGPTERKSEPYLITWSEFSSKINNYDQIVVTYYLGDGVLIEDDGRPHPADEIDELGGFKLDIEDAVGKSNLENPDNEDVLYIRNERYGVEYEVNFDPRSYYKDVLGEFGTKTD